MDGDDQSIPDGIKSSLRERARTLLSNQQFDVTATLDFYELELFNWYVQKTEKILSEMQSDELAYIHKQYDADVENVNDSGMLAVEYYLKRVRYSHVIYGTSLLEMFLERSCEKLKSVLGREILPFTVEELKGDQWSTKRKFLERYGKFEIPDTIWSGINTLTFLRNILVHDNGSTRDLRTDDRNMLAKQPGIRLTDHYIVIEAEYVSTALRSIQSLVQFVEARVEEVIKRAIRPTTVAKVPQ